jgi:hypothetical protein
MNGQQPAFQQPIWYIPCMSNKLKAAMERVGHWSEADQAELANYAEEIERRHSGRYDATSEELAAIDDADRSGTATEEQVAAAFFAFRRA